MYPDLPKTIALFIAVVGILLSVSVAIWGVIMGILSDGPKQSERAKQFITRGIIWFAVWVVPYAFLRIFF